MLTIEEGKRYLGIMPAVTQEAMGLKLVSFYPGNAGTGVPHPPRDHPAVPPRYRRLPSLATASSPEILKRSHLSFAIIDNIKMNEKRSGAIAQQSVQRALKLRDKAVLLRQG